MKCPIYIFLNEAGKIPLRLVLAHMYCGFIDSRNSTEEMKKKAYATAKKRTYKYLEIRYKKLALNLIQKPELGTEVNNAPIWILWWQGEKNAPDIVKHCISSIKRNSGDHPVKIIGPHRILIFVCRQSESPPQLRRDERRAHAPAREYAFVGGKYHKIAEVESPCLQRPHYLQPFERLSLERDGNTCKQLLQYPYVCRRHHLRSNGPQTADAAVIFHGEVQFQSHFPVIPQLRGHMADDIELI